MAQAKMTSEPGDLLTTQKVAFAVMAVLLQNSLASFSLTLGILHSHKSSPNSMVWHFFPG
jgi:hypothetical protein